MAISTYDGSYAVEVGAGFDQANVKGKSVVITGGASGMGEHMARAFTTAGAWVTIGDLQEDRGQRVASETGAAFVKVDVSVWQDQIKLFKTAIEKSPTHTVNVVVANAGHSGRDPLYWDDSEPDGEPIEPDLRIMNSCLVGCMYTIKLALHYFDRQPEGHQDRSLILMSSIAGYCEQPGTPVYVASKHGIRGMMLSLRRTLPTKGMRINLLAPWYVRSPAIPQENQDRLSSKGVVWAEGVDAAQATLHIAADEQLNGRCLAVVPRSTDPRGYMDMNKDDFTQDDIAAEWQKVMIAASHRA